MHCLECGSEAPTGFRFCGNCGALLLADRAEDPAHEAGDRAARGGVVRPDLPPDAGERADGEDHSDEVAAAPASLWSRAGRLLAAATVLALVAAGVSWISKDRPHDAATEGRGTATNNGVYDAPDGRDLEVVRWRRDLQETAYRPLGAPVIASDVVYAANPAAVAAVGLDDGDRIWRAEVPDALGLATDRAHVFVRSSDRLHALDRRTGTLRWSHRLARGVFDVAQRVSPLHLDGAVFVVTPTGALRSFTADGVERWSLDPDQLVETGSNPRLVSGLVRAGDHLVTLAWGREVWGRATAIDPATGEVVWTANVGATLPHPPVSVGGAVVLVGSGQLTALDIRTGDVRWRRDVALDTAGDDALVAAVGGHVVALTSGGSFQRFDWSDGGETSVGAWQGSAPLRITPAGDTVTEGSGGVVVHTAEGEVAAYDVVSATARWRTQVGVPSAASATAGRLVVTPTEDGALAATDERTGQVRWTTPIRAALFCGVTGGGDLTYLVLPEGPIHAFHTANGTVQWSLDDTSGRGELTAGAERAAVLDGGLVQFIDAQSGQAEEAGSAGGGTRHGVTLDAERAVAVGGNPVGLGGGTGWVRSLDATTARSQWLTYLDDPPAASAAVGNGLVVVATEGGDVVALSGVSGRERWRYDGTLPVTAAPVVTGDVVVVPDLSGALTALALDDGAIIWQHELGLPLRGEPVVASELLIARHDERRLVAIDAATGQRRWDVTVSQDMTSPPSIAGTSVYVGTRAGVASFVLSSGEARLNLPLGAPVVEPPVLGRHGAVVCLANGSILALGG